MAQTLTVRTAIPADLAAIDVLLGRSYPALLKDHYPPSVLVTAIPYISKAQPKLLASGTYFVVQDEMDEVVGAGGWTATPPGTKGMEQGRVGHVRHVVTDHRRTRGGIGRRLMAHVFETAKDAGIAKMECMSTMMAVPFYASCGFKEVGPISVDLVTGISFPAVLMRRDL